MNDIREQLKNIGIVPVIKLETEQQAQPLAAALLAGGISCAEVTFRTAAAAGAIRAIAQTMPEVLVGAGTVLTVEQADEALDAGAAFIVTPGFNPKVVDHCVRKGVPVTPGCATPTEMEQALERGVEVIKFFPAEAMGGLAMLRAVAAPYPALRFLPTGGIGEHNLAEYLAFDRVLACGGSWMVKPAWIAEGRFDEVTGACARAAAIVREARG